MAQSVRAHYERLAQAGEIVPDDNQRALAEALDTLLAALAERDNRRRKGLGRFFARHPRSGPRGLYIWGGVGRGKTLLMDLFYAAAPSIAKRRVHFHAFMAEVHDRAEAFRRKGKADGAKSGDPIAAAATDIAAEAKLLCFDEFMVNDIADAMILGRLFERLFALGIVVVATSNIAPDDLYQDGLNRSLFLPFIALLQQRLDVVRLDAPRDYRLDSAGTERRYVVPPGPEASACLDAHFRHQTGGDRGERMEIEHKGRRIVVPEAATGVARFAFADLCTRPLGAGDYLRIAEAFHTMILADIPVLEESRRNEVRRFIDLIDTLYDRSIRLVASAEAEPQALWLGTHGPETHDFARAASRLMEMRSDVYWEAASRRWAETKKARAI